jgi:hypothetical protein
MSPAILGEYHAALNSDDGDESRPRRADAEVSIVNV